MLMPTTVRNRLPKTLVEAWSTLAWRAMLTEVNLSPKPGLVDRFNAGAHKDMSLIDFQRSAAAIRQWFPTFINWGAESVELTPAEVLQGARDIGLNCEADMFRATEGVNTHKGSIFSLGLICTALGRLEHCRLKKRAMPVTAASVCACVASFCEGITRRELQHNNPSLTAGQRLYQQLGLTGARGEAEAGFPLVVDHALPHYQQLIAQGRDPELALLDTLLLLIARNGDTNVASRGGAEGLHWIQQQARELLQNGGLRRRADLPSLIHFDNQCIARNLSPGGSADLLIVTWFFAHLPHVSFHL